MAKTGKSPRLARETLAYGTIADWFSDALPRSAPHPSEQQLFRLADHFKVLLNRANNAELARCGPVNRVDLKDVSPGEVFDELVQNVVSAVIALENFSGPVLKAKKQDIYLAEFASIVKTVRLLHLPLARPKQSRGKPPVPWKNAGRRFAEAVRELLREIRYRGETTVTSPTSASVVIATSAINWAYVSRLTPEGFVSAIRERSRAKPRSPVSLIGGNKPRT